MSNDKVPSNVVLITSVVAIILSLYSVVEINKLKDGGAPAAAPSGIAGQPSAPSKPVDVSVDDDPSMGNAKAKVTVIEFSDFECPFCGRYFSQTLPQIKSDYIDTGKINYVFRDFPLSFHASARPAALAADCVFDKTDSETYFKYHDLLYSNQQSLTTDNLKKWASDLGVDIADCLDKEEFSAEVAKDVADGQAAGVRGTPAFFINGTLVSGAQPFEAFKAAIDAELAK